MTITRTSLERRVYDLEEDLKSLTELVAKMNLLNFEQTKLSEQIVSELKKIHCQKE